MKKITRVWHGVTKSQHQAAYLKFVEESGIKDYRSVKGNLSTKILTRIDGDICHFLTVTEWDSYDSIKKFAGNDFQKARYYPGDEKYLLEFEEQVLHFETFEY